MNARSMAQIFLLSAFWGVSFLMIRIAGTGFPPLWIALGRCLLGAALLWSVLLLTGRKTPPLDRMPWLCLVAFFNNALPFTCFAWGERVVPSNTASVLNATTPIWTLLLTIAIYRTRARWNVLFGVLLGFAGVLLVVMHQTSGIPAAVSRAHFLAGAALIVIGSFGYAIATVIAKAKLQGVDALGIAASQLALAAVMVAPLALLTARPAHLHAPQWLSIAVLGLLGSGLAYLLYFHLLTTISATHVVAVTYLLPIWGVLWGLLAHERIGLSTCTGVLISIAGLVLMNLRQPGTAAVTIPSPHPRAAS